MSEGIERVGVVGAGLMGAGIAEVSAKAGCAVTVCDINDAAVSAGRSRIETSLERAVKSGKLDDDARSATLGRIHFVTDIGELADRQLVVEAVRRVRGREARRVPQPRQDRGRRPTRSWRRTRRRSRS